MTTMNPIPEESLQRSHLLLPDSASFAQRRLVRSVVAAVVWALLGLWLRSNPALLERDLFVAMTAFASFAVLTLWGPVALLESLARYLGMS